MIDLDQFSLFFINKDDVFKNLLCKLVQEQHEIQRGERERSAKCEEQNKYLQQSKTRVRVGKQEKEERSRRRRRHSGRRMMIKKEGERLSGIEK